MCAWPFKDPSFGNTYLLELLDPMTQCGFPLVLLGTGEDIKAWEGVQEMVIELERERRG